MQTFSATNPANSAVFKRPRTSPWPAIPVDEALRIVDEHVHAGKITAVHIRQAQTGCVLAEDIYASKPQPEYRTSVKDGYAVIAADGQGLKKVVCKTTAGDLSNVTLKPGTACRVNTGSMIPDGADAVVQIEDTKLVEHDNVEEISVETLREAKVGQDIRQIGSDVALGELVLPKHSVLGAPEMGILASIGIKYIQIYKRPKIAVISTGHELVDGDSNDCPPGLIRDSIRPQQLALFRGLGFKTVDMGIVPDLENELEKVLKDALMLSDVVVCSGGVSMGEKDFMKGILQNRLNFTIKFGRVRMKPGLPTTFAYAIQSGVPKFVFALPGNPVSAYVTSLLFVVPALKKIGGWSNYYHTQIDVKVIDEMQLDDRPEFRRARLLSSSSALDHIPRAVCTDRNQASSRLLSARCANLLLEIPAKSEHRTRLDENDVVRALIIAPL